MHVHLDVVRPLLQGPFDGREGVLRRDAARAPVGDDLDIAIDTHRFDQVEPDQSGRECRAGQDALEDLVEAVVAQSQKRSPVFDILTNPTNVTVEVV